METKMQQDNETRFASSCRDALEHILNFLATEDISECAKAESASKDAVAQAFSRREWAIAKRRESGSKQISSLGGTSRRIQAITPTPVHPYLGDGGDATFVQSAEKARRRERVTGLNGD